MVSSPKEVSLYPFENHFGFGGALTFWYAITLLGLDSILYLPHLSISSRAWMIINFSLSPFLGTSKRWYVSIFPHSTEVTGWVNSARGYLTVTVIRMSESPLSLALLVGRIGIRRDKLQRLKIIIRYYCTLRPCCGYLTQWWYIERDSCIFIHGWPLSTMYDVSTLDNQILVEVFYLSKIRLGGNLLERSLHALVEPLNDRATVFELIDS